MISIKHVKKFCNGDITKIENYDKAINDKTQMWVCHHRRQTIYTREELKEIGEYENRPPEELIFLTKSEHERLHFTVCKGAEDRKSSRSTAMKEYFADPINRQMHSERTKGKRHVKAQRPVVQYDLEGNFIKEYPSITDAKKETHLYHISEVAMGYRKQTGGYVFRYK